MTPNRENTPNNRYPGKMTAGGSVIQGKTQSNIVSRIKMLLAAGAVAGTVGGWTALAQHDAAKATQADNSQPTTAQAIATATSEPQAAAVLQMLAQATATMPEATALQLAAVNTKAPAIATTAAIAEATATAQATATAVPQATATTAKPTATARPAAVAKTKSSR